MAMTIPASVTITAEASGQQAVNQLADSLRRVGQNGEASARQTANAMRMVPAQLTDIATQLAGGQSPFLIMMQQGGQLRDMFGSITGALVGVGRTIAPLLNPVTALAAAFAAIGYAAYKGSSEYRDLQNQLTLTGNAAGYTAGQIEKMAYVLSDTVGVSVGKARDLAAGLAGTGQFVGQNLDIAEQAAARVQKLSGATSDQVIKDFATMSKGVAAWAAAHNESYNYLTFAEFKHIKNLEDMGQHEEAMRANMEALNKEFATRREELGYIETAWKNITEWASKAWAAMMNWGKPDSKQDTLATLRQQLAQVEEEMTISGNMLAKGGTKIVTPGANNLESQRQLLQEKIRLLQTALEKENSMVADKAKEQAEIRKRIRQTQNGELDAMENARIQLGIEREKGATEKRIAALEEEGTKVENQYKARAITEEEYNREKLRIARNVLNERLALAEKEAQAENKRPANTEAAKISQQAKVQAIKNQMAQLRAEYAQLGLKAEGDEAARDRMMQEAVDKFGRAQQARIDQIEAEAASSNMSTLEYKKHTEALRIDKEAADAIVGKSPEYVAAIKAEAAAKKEATNAALEKADADKRAFGTGARDAIKDYLENVNNAATQSKNLFTDAFKGMEDALVNFVKTGKLDFSQLADSIITDMARILIQKNILGPLIEGISGGGAIGEIASMMGFANGGIMTSDGSVPLNKYASGGVAKSPQLALFGEGKTPEAFVPLPDGRNIPVKMQGDGGGANVTVNVVNNANNTQATTQERQGANGARIIDVFIEQVKASIAADISRGVGSVTGAIERTYGANRAAGAY